VTTEFVNHAEVLVAPLADIAVDVEKYSRVSDRIRPNRPLIRKKRHC